MKIITSDSGKIAGKECSVDEIFVNKYTVNCEKLKKS
jgi:hypothetical protein